MNILGIDPNLNRAAYVVVSQDNVILKQGYVDNNRFEEDITNIVHNYSVRISGIEMMTSQGQAVGKTVFITLVWLGFYFKTLRSLGVDVQLVPRPVLKKAVTGKAICNDSAIRKTLIDIYGKQGVKKTPGNTYGISGDVWQALGVAHALQTWRDSFLFELNKIS